MKLFVLYSFKNIPPFNILKCRSKLRFFVMKCYENIGHDINLLTVDNPSPSLNLKVTFTFQGG